MSLRLALIGDIHYGFPEDEEMEEYMEPALEEIINDMNEFSPDLVVGLGDCIDHTEREEDLEKIARVGEILESLEPDFYAIPGNHDPVNISRREMLEGLSPENNGTYFSLDTGERKLVFLDTFRKMEDVFIPGMIGEDQRNWLEKQLDTEREVLVFSHHLLHYRNLEDNWYFFDKPEEAACIDKSMIHDSLEKKVRAVFSGHIHQAGMVRHRKVPHFTLPGVNKFDPPEKFEKNHAKVEVEEEEIEAEIRDREYSA